MGSSCDGGGNRYLSNVILADHPDLGSYFGSTDSIPSGVCSILVGDDRPPWIVCPRRLMALGNHSSNAVAHQRQARKFLIHHAGFDAGSIGVWPELKLKYSEGTGRDAKSFDYTFDYILMPVQRVPLQEAVSEVAMQPDELRSTLEGAGYSLVVQDGVQMIEGFPMGNPCIVEIMASSTSGGSKAKGSTIPVAFANAIMRRPHRAPGINYRQVWARMVSQLIVKSEVGLGWGGKTLWVLQGTLVDYISRSTALNIRQFLSEATSEVNILCMEYGDSYKTVTRPIELGDIRLYAGPISPSDSNDDIPAFQDMIRAPLKPSRSQLIQVLVKKAPANMIDV